MGKTGKRHTDIECKNCGKMTERRIAAQVFCSRACRYEYINKSGYMNKWLYGLDKETYDKMMKEQNGRCAICGVDAKLVVDHCHDKGTVRGLLCQHCNTGLGHFKDNIQSIENAVKYLKILRIHK